MDTALSTFVASVLLVAACGVTATALASRSEPSMRAAGECRNATNMPHAAAAQNRNTGCRRLF